MLIPKEKWSHPY
jgi:Xaa-Pro dipeptidase